MAASSDEEGMIMVPKRLELRERIEFVFSDVGFAKRNNANSRPSWSPNYNVKPLSDAAKGDETLLAITQTGVFEHKSGFPVERFDGREIHPVLFKVFAPLGFIPAETSRAHDRTFSRIGAVGQSECSYNLLADRMKAP